MVKQNFDVLSSEKVRSVLSESLARTANPHFLCYFSTQWMGFTIDPSFYAVPVEDHGFHRGDGVFEAIRVVEGRPYLLEPHLERLQHSASQIGLELPMDVKMISDLCYRAIEVAGEKNLIFRLFVTRGPGSFGPNPKESKAPQLYLAVLRFNGLNEEAYARGVKIGRSRIPCKDPFFAKVKSLNYLPNVLMKAEANERGLDYTVFVDGKGCLLEGSTENLVIISDKGELVHPPLEFILRGCTMRRLFDLVEAKNLMPVLRGRPLTENDLHTAREAFMIGTTLDVLPVVEYEGRRLSSGPWIPKLREILRQDQKEQT